MNSFEKKEVKHYENILCTELKVNYNNDNNYYCIITVKFAK